MLSITLTHYLMPRRALETMPYLQKEIESSVQGVPMVALLRWTLLRKTSLLEALGFAVVSVNSPLLVCCLCRVVAQLAPPVAKICLEERKSSPNQANLAWLARCWVCSEIAWPCNFGQFWLVQWSRRFCLQLRFPLPVFKFVGSVSNFVLSKLLSGCRFQNFVGHGI